MGSQWVSFLLFKKIRIISSFFYFLTVFFSKSQFCRYNRNNCIEDIGKTVLKKILFYLYISLWKFYLKLYLKIDRLDLLPTSKGLVAGELTLTLADNRIIDCTVSGGALIPHLASNVISVRSKARLVLIVEKDAVFQKLLEDDCTSSLNCILVTGKGYPDVATRMLVKLLSEKLELPVYIIVDADPFGVDIMCVYR